MAFQNLNLSVEEINSLMSSMRTLLIERGETDKLDFLNEHDFTGWVEKLKQEYTDNDLSDDFKSYILNSIYYTICYDIDI